MALGLHLSGLDCQLHAMGVCDDPDYFYDYMDGLLEGMGATKDTVGQLHTMVTTQLHFCWWCLINLTGYTVWVPFTLINDLCASCSHSQLGTCNVCK